MREISPEEMELYRDALSSAIQCSTLRAVAAQVGMSPTGLSNFVDGTVPYGKTVERVREWFSRHAADALPLAAARPWLAFLLPGLPRDEADQLLRSLASDAAKTYRLRCIKPPLWVKEISQ